MAKGRMTKTCRKAAPRRTSTKKPYGGSRYGNDAFVKIENVEPLATLAGTTGEVFSTMRVCAGIDPSPPGN